MKPASVTPASFPETPPGREQLPEHPYPWLTYAEAATYTGWSVAYLRNLVSAGQNPVYGKPRVRRFRRGA